MKKSFIITLLIICINAVFFTYEGHIYIAEQSYLYREILHSVYKILAYIGPVVLILGLKYISKHTKKHRSRPVSYRWYLIYLVRGFLVYIGAKNSSTELGTYTIFYVWVINSVVEESVFRGYIQKYLTDIYGYMKGIIGQAVLFSLVHLPFYWLHYQTGVYTQIDSYISTLLHIPTLGPSILLLSLGTPLVLGLLWGYTRHRSGSLWPSIILHSLYNGMVLFM